jgi:integrase
MKLAASGSRGVLWRSNPRGTQKVRHNDGRREQGDWWIRWSCPHGHLHRALIGPKSLAQKEAERHRLERPCPRHAAKPASYLLADVIDEYLKATRSYKRSAREDERHGKFWKDRLGSRPLEDIGPRDLAAVRTELLEGAEPGDGLAPGTANRKFALLRRVYNVAIRDGKTEGNPVAKLGMLKEPSGRVRYLSDEEEAELMKALPTHCDRQRVTVLLQTGLRKSEFLGLRWKDIDLRNGVLTIPRSKNGESRHVPLTSTVKGILLGLPRALDASALVFPNSEGKKDLRWAEKAFPKAAGDARIDDFRLHDTRHTFASRLAMEGVDLLTIKELGGWKTLSMVQRYAHLSPGHRQSAIERLASRRPAGQPKARAGGAE